MRVETSAEVEKAGEESDSAATPIVEAAGVEWERPVAGGWAKSAAVGFDRSVERLVRDCRPGDCELIADKFIAIASRGAEIPDVCKSPRASSAVQNGRKRKPARFQCL